MDNWNSIQSITRLTTGFFIGRNLMRIGYSRPIQTNVHAFNSHSINKQGYSPLGEMPDRAEGN